MKRLLSIRYSETGFNFSMLLLRLMFGVSLIVNHGLVKMTNFAKMSGEFYDPFGIGHKWALVLAIFAEVFCSMFIVLGLFTRIMVLPLIVTMVVALFGVHKGNLAEGELAAAYLCVYLVLLLCGPGKISVDGLIKK